MWKKYLIVVTISQVDEKLQETVRLEWFKDDTRLDLDGASPESNASRFVLHSNNSLTIINVSEDDVGNVHL